MTPKSVDSFQGMLCHLKFYLFYFIKWLSYVIEHLAEICHKFLMEFDEKIIMNYDNEKSSISICTDQFVHFNYALVQIDA